MSCWGPLTHTTQAHLHCAASVLIPLLSSLPQTVQGGGHTAGLFQQPQGQLVSVGKCRETRSTQRKSPIFLGCSLPLFPGFHQMPTHEVTREQ